MSTQEMYGGLSAAADLSAKQYHIVRLSAAKTTNQASNAADYAIAGVLQNKPAANEHASVAFEGRGKIVLGATTAANDFVTTDSSGRATPVVSGGTSLVVARALQGGAATNIVDCVYYKPFPWPGSAI